MRFLYKKAFPRKLLSRWLRHSDSEASCLVINCECRRRLKHLPHLLERCWWRWPAHLRCNNHCCSNHNYNDVTQQLCRSRATAKLLCSTTQRPTVFQTITSQEKLSSRETMVCRHSSTQEKMNGVSYLKPWHITPLMFCSSAGMQTMVLTLIRLWIRINLKI